MILKEEKVLGQLKFNILTKEMYDALCNDGDVSEDEMYVIEEEVDHNILKNRNQGFQHTASAIVFEDLFSLQSKYDAGTLSVVLQEMGDNAYKAMSQEAVTAELNKIYSALISFGWEEE